MARQETRVLLCIVVGLFTRLYLLNSSSSNVWLAQTNEKIPFNDFDSDDWSNTGVNRVHRTKIYFVVKKTTWTYWRSLLTEKEEKCKDSMYRGAITLYDLQRMEIFMLNISRKSRWNANIWCIVEHSIRNIISDSERSLLLLTKKFSTAAVEFIIILLTLSMSCALISTNYRILRLNHRNFIEQQAWNFWLYETFLQLNVSFPWSNSLMIDRLDYFVHL